MHPHGPRKTFNWPQAGDSCYVPIKNIVCAIQAPTTITGRTYKICNEDYNKTVDAFAKLHSWTVQDAVKTCFTKKNLVYIYDKSKN